MNGVIDALQDVVRRSDVRLSTEFLEREWKTVNDKIEGQNNARFQVSGNELELRATKEFPKSSSPIEIFVSYGDIRAYWIAGIARDPGNYPKAMVDAVNFFYNSPNSNWTLQQKQRWGYCEDILDGDGKLPTLLYT